MRRDLNTLKFERNTARAAIWWSRTGVPVQVALDARELPFHGGAFLIRALSGVLGPLDLVVFAHLCTLYLARRPSDRRLEVSLAEVARWLGARSVGGEQRRIARASLERLLGATFTSRLRWTDKGSEQWVEGWHLVERFILPLRGGHAGSIWLSVTMADLLDQGSVVFLDARLLRVIVRRSPVAARLWVYLEAETLTADRQQRYALFGPPPGATARQRSMAPITEMLRLTDKQRGQSVLLVRRACLAIMDVDPRYELAVERAMEPGMWNLVASRHRKRTRLQATLDEVMGPLEPTLTTRATQATTEGDPGNATRATQATADGDPGNACGANTQVESRSPVLGRGATRATLPKGLDTLCRGRGQSESRFKLDPTPGVR